MNRLMLRPLAAACAGTMLALSPLAASAQPAPASDLTSDQVRAEFLRFGYLADAPMTWWTSNRVTTFSVSDQTQQASRTGRVLMVLVYPDSVTAEAERSQAQAREAGDTSESFTLDHGPHIVPGYGWSLWWRNVAMVESTHQGLARIYAANSDRDSLLMEGAGEVTPFSPAQVTYAVDFDFAALLDHGIVNL
jgi:hypothetical protein